MKLDSKSKIAFVSWTFYDLGNTAYSTIIISSFFPLFITQLTGSNRTLGAASISAMVLSALAVPFLGALTDHTGSTKRYLVYTTLACIGLLSLLAFTKVAWMLVVFYAFSAFFYHVSLVLYNSLLPEVAPPHQQGFASGFGIGMGCLGGLLTIPAAYRIDAAFGKPAVFLFAGIFFLVFSLPLFVFVPERRVPSPVRFQWSLWLQEWKRVLKTIWTLPKKPALLYFLIGNFLVVDVLNGLVCWFMVIARELFNAGPRELRLLLMSTYLAAFAGAVLSGMLADRIGALRMMGWAAGIVCLTVVGLALSPSIEIFIAMASLHAALGFAPIWGIGRKVVIDLTSEEDLGENFGLYGLTLKLSIIASLVFSILADLLGFRAVLWTITVPALAGVGCLWLSLFESKKRPHPAGLPLS